MASKIIAAESHISAAEAAAELTIMIGREESQGGLKAISVGGGVSIPEKSPDRVVYVAYALLSDA